MGAECGSGRAKEEEAMGTGTEQEHQGGGREAQWHATQGVGKCSNCVTGWCEVN